MNYLTDLKTKKNNNEH